MLRPLHNATTASSECHDSQAFTRQSGFHTTVRLSHDSQGPRAQGPQGPKGPKSVLSFFRHDALAPFWDFGPPIWFPRTSPVHCDASRPPNLPGKAQICEIWIFWIEIGAPLWGPPYSPTWGTTVSAAGWPLGSLHWFCSATFHGSVTYTYSHWNDPGVG